MLPGHARRDTMGQDVMSSLYIERLLDLGVRREEEVNEDDGWDDEEGEEFI